MIENIIDNLTVKPNFIHNDFKFLTLLQIFIFKIFVLTQGIYFFLFPQLFFQKKMNVNSQF